MSGRPGGTGQGARLCARVIGVIGMIAAIVFAIPAVADAARSKAKPNIVVVMSDDQPPASFNKKVMPNVISHFERRGTFFNNFATTTPLCCPSRATFFTGQYGHNNGVLKNDYGNLVDKRNVLPAWLHNAGYQTALVGKFLNGYERSARRPTDPAPGWDRWFMEMEPRRYYRWKASNGKKVRNFGSRNGDHATTITSKFAARWARQMAASKKPFFLNVNYYAPHIAPGRDEGECHSAPVPVPGDRVPFRRDPLPTPPNFNQADVSGMSEPIRKLPLLTRAKIRQLTDRYRCILGSVRGIDNGFERIRDALRKARELRKTVFVFTNDNGVYLGEHRIAKGKRHPFEEIVRVPFAISAPKRFRIGDGRQVSVASVPVANIDIAPTLLDIAKAKPCVGLACRVLDGRSLLPALEPKGEFPKVRPIGLEVRSCRYRGARLDGFVYIENLSRGKNGNCRVVETEMYDLKVDRYQIHNLLPAEEGSEIDERRKQLAELTEKLAECSGVEGRDPFPPSGHYCG